MIRSSIDLGTNTCLLLITKWNEKDAKITEVIGDYATIVRLGEGVDQNHVLLEVPMERTFQCLKKYSAQVRASGGLPEKTICVGTSQARDAKNSREFFDRVKKETGFSFRVISGEDEAKYTFLGALLPEMTPKTSMVIDIGGGSTELIGETGGLSVDVGSVRYTERFLKLKIQDGTSDQILNNVTQNIVTDDQFWACQDEIDRQLQPLIEWKRNFSGSNSLVGVAGTVTTLAGWYLNLKEFDSRKVDGTMISRGDVHRMVEELKWRTVAERCELPGMDPMRADVILAGSLILWRTMELLDFPELIVSTRGLRYGILIDNF